MTSKRIVIFLIVLGIGLGLAWVMTSNQRLSQVNETKPENAAQTMAVKAPVISPGEALYESLGCIGCHATSTDEVWMGPSLMGFSKHYSQSYIIDAIRDPDKDIPQGYYKGAMPAFELSDEQMQALLDYLKAL